MQLRAVSCVFPLKSSRARKHRMCRDMDHKATAVSASGRTAALIGSCCAECPHCRRRLLPAAVQLPRRVGALCNSTSRRTPAQARAVGLSDDEHRRLAAPLHNVDRESRTDPRATACRQAQRRPRGRRLGRTQSPRACPCGDSNRGPGCRSAACANPRFLRPSGFARRAASAVPSLHAANPGERETRP